MKTKRVLVCTVILALSLLSAFVMLFPVKYAQDHTPPGYEFSGQASWFDPWDLNVYVSAIRSGQAGGILLKNLYTTEPNRPILMYPTYTILGRLFPTADPFMAFYAASIVTAALLIFCVYILSGFFFTETTVRIAVVVTVAFGGGFGFLFYPVYSPDIQMTSFTFMSALQRPHEAIGIASYLFAVVWYFQLIRSGKSSVRQVLAGSAAAALAVFYYPYSAVPFFAVVSLWTVIAGRRIPQVLRKVLVPIMILPVLSMIFAWGELRSNPTFDGVVSQVLPTPSILEVIGGYGILAPLSLYALFRVRDGWIRFLGLWVVLSVLLAYFPLGIARFFLRGLYFPMALLGVAGATALFQRLRLPRTLGLVILTMIVLPSALFVFAKRIQEAGRLNPWLYIPEDDFRAMTYLKNAGVGDTGVLALYRAGNMLPALTGRSVYAGHLIQTPDAAAKFNEVREFFSGVLLEARAHEFLRKNRITYVFFGQEEQIVSGKHELTYPFLSREFSSHDAVVYRVK